MACSAGRAGGEEHIGAVDVGHDPGEQELQLGLAVLDVAGLAHPEVLQVVDLAFDFGSLSELGDRAASGLGEAGCLEAGLVVVQRDAPAGR